MYALCVNFYIWHKDNACVYMSCNNLVYLEVGYYKFERVQMSGRWDK